MQLNNSRESQCYVTRWGVRRCSNRKWCHALSRTPQFGSRVFWKPRLQRLSKKADTLLLFLQSTCHMDSQVSGDVSQTARGKLSIVQQGQMVGKSQVWRRWPKQMVIHSLSRSAVTEAEVRVAGGRQCLWVMKKIKFAAATWTGQMHRMKKMFCKGQKRFCSD